MAIGDNTVEEIEGGSEPGGTRRVEYGAPSLQEEVSRPHTQVQAGLSTGSQCEESGRDVGLRAGNGQLDGGASWVNNICQ